jgi:hypothetical protein
MLFARAPGLKDLAHRTQVTPGWEAANAPRCAPEAGLQRLELPSR